MAAKKRGLGRGLDALLGSAQPTVKPVDQQLSSLPVEWLRPGKFQPRQTMDQETLADLAASIKAQGVMQPIVVRPVGKDQFEIIAGERRWRASQLAGLEKVPVVIKDVGDESALAMSLIENIQREDLNPIEEAVALHRLMNEFQLTHQQIADAVGKSRTAVTNYLRLMNLSQEAKTLLEQGLLEMGHARTLLGLPEALQGEAAREVVRKNLNVRQTEALVKVWLAPRKQNSEKVVDRDVELLEEKLSHRVGQRVHIQQGGKGKGKLVIPYGSLDELDGILQIFGDLD